MKKSKTLIGKINQMLGFQSDTDFPLNTPQPKEQKIESNFSSGDFSPWQPLVLNQAFDGEKTPGEMGAIVNLIPMHQALRARAYEADLKTDVIKIITGRFFKWVVGTGLKLQSEPNEVVLRSEGINDSLIDFRKITEARFQVYSGSTFSDYSHQTNLHERAEEAFRSAFLGGDCLIICRIENGVLNTQVIDGQEVVNPDKDSYYTDAKNAGNYIEQGIEISEKGEHVAYFVRMRKIKEISIERIVAKGKTTGRTFAWMLYGTKHRINHQRGIPQISSILEKVSKLDRYTEASVAGAEERAKIVYAVEHNRDSTGENPIIDAMKKNFNPGDAIQDSYKLAETVTKNIKLTTEKMAFNMPIGSKLSMLDSTQELQYEPFFRGVFVQLCAAVDIPPEVALQQYNSNYSASRAAINGWGYIVDIYRKKFSNNFYKKIYALWLEVEILKGKIDAPGYLKASEEDNYMALEAYTSARFTGNNMPHIDPLKEVKAIREMLGDPANGIPPLINLDKASELLNQGDWLENLQKYLEEIKNLEPLKPAQPDVSEK
jgi:capsid protein